MKTLVLTIDFINELVHPEGKTSYGAGWMQDGAVMNAVNQTIAWGRAHDHLVAHVKVGFSPSYIECPKSSPLFSQAPKFEAYQLGEWGTEFHGDLDVQPEDYIVTKHRVSPFYATGFEALLRANQIEHLVVTGVSTSMAVIACARDAHDRDIKVTVVEDACAARIEGTHDMAIELMQPFANVIKAGELD